MANINNAWQAASQEMYAATQGAGGQPGADGGFGGAGFGGDGQPGGSANGNGQGATDNVTDVDYEEVDGSNNR
jgi:molecular chaperone DnaK